MEFTPSLQQYKPILWLNDYWNLNRDYMPINSSTPLLNLTLTFQPLSMFKWQMYSAQTMRNRSEEYHMNTEQIKIKQVQHAERLDG